MYPVPTETNRPIRRSTKSSVFNLVAFFWFVSAVNIVVLLHFCRRCCWHRIDISHVCSPKQKKPETEIHEAVLTPTSASQVGWFVSCQTFASKTLFSRNSNLKHQIRDWLWINRLKQTLIKNYRLPIFFVGVSTETETCSSNRSHWTLRLHRNNRKPVAQIKANRKKGSFSEK